MGLREGNGANWYVSSGWKDWGSWMNFCSMRVKKMEAKWYDKGMKKESSLRGMYF